MPITIAQMLQGMASSGEGGANAVNQKAADKRQRELQEYLQGQKPITAGAEQAAKNEENIKTLNDPRVQDLVNEGGSASVGDIHLGGNPYAKLAGAGSKEAQAFLKTAQSSYKPINEQLDAGQSTIDMLNQGNANSDKLALINEARLAAGQGGSRAISHMVDLLSGGQTAASDFQGKLNWLQNTPNIPTLQPAQRDSIRESTFNRLNQLEQLHNQAQAALAQQGAIIAPHADYSTLLGSVATPVSQKLSNLKKMQAEYQSQRSKMSPNAVSAPAQANDNPTTLDRLKSFFGGSSQQAPQQAQPQTLRVKHKASGQTGTIPASEFDPSIYDQVQ